VVGVSLLFVTVAGEGKKAERHLCNGNAIFIQWGKKLNFDTGTLFT
jgi:hypothetical protein